MPKTFIRSFTRRGPDIITEELSSVLSENIPLEFKVLFDLLYAKLRGRNSVGGGEEMLRLRAYEKLQDLVSRGMVSKINKKYRGLASLASAFPGIAVVPVAGL
jgi:hypothetical protein